MAGEPGFEPGLLGPEPSVLPLNYSPAAGLAAAGVAVEENSSTSRGGGVAAAEHTGVALGL